MDQIGADGPARWYSASRREVLRFGAWSSLGLSLPGLLQARSAQAGSHTKSSLQAKITSCIFIFYYGGPSHLDTFDMKPDAPLEVRGEFQPIATSVPGLRICEHLPRTARVCTVLRSYEACITACATITRQQPKRFAAIPLRGATWNCSAMTRIVFPVTGLH